MTVSNTPFITTLLTQYTKRKSYYLIAFCYAALLASPTSYAENDLSKQYNNQTSNSNQSSQPMMILPPELQDDLKKSFEYRITKSQTAALQQFHRWKALQAQSYDSAAAGDWKRSITQATDALAIAKATFSKDNSNTATTLAHLGKLHSTLGDLAKAKQYYTQSLSIENAIAKKNGTQQPELARSQLGLGSIYILEKNGKAALLLLKSAYAILNNGFFKQHDPNKAAVLFELGKAHFLVNDIAQAKKRHQQSLAIRTKALGDSHISVAESLNELAMLNYKQGNYPQAATLLERSLVISRDKYGNSHPETYLLMRNALRLHQKAGNKIKANQTCNQLYSVWKMQPNLPAPNCTKSN